MFIGILHPFQRWNFKSDLEIVGLDRPNLLNDVVTSLGQMKINILNIHADVVDMKAIIKLKISVEDASRLQQAIDNIDRIQGIYELNGLFISYCNFMNIIYNQFNQWTMN